MIRRPDLRLVSTAAPSPAAVEVRAERARMHDDIQRADRTTLGAAFSTGGDFMSWLDAVQDATTLTVGARERARQLRAHINGELATIAAIEERRR